MGKEDSPFFPIDQASRWCPRGYPGEGWPGGAHGHALFKIATYDALNEAMDDVLHQRMDGSWQNRFSLLLTHIAPVTSRVLLGRGAKLHGHAA